METMVMIPTYNEARTIADLIGEIRALPYDIHILVVDDDSPDGTAAAVEDIAHGDPRVHLMLRRERRGRGWAGIDGLRHALNAGAQFIMEMDGDGSHHPRYIPSFIESARAGAAVVSGSRFVPGGKDDERGLARQLISQLARRYLALMLGVRAADPTSGFRLFRRDVVEAILPRLAARDPFIVTEMLFHARRAGFHPVEVPIEFLPRRAGESKLTSGILLTYLIRVVRLRMGLNS